MPDPTLTEPAPPQVRRRLSRGWRLRALGITVLAVLVVLGIGTPLEDWLRNRSIDALHRRLSAEQLTLSEEALQARMLPVIARPDLSIMMTDLPAGDRSRAEQIVWAAMDVYPPEMLHRLLDHIILAGNLLFWTDQEVGGFYFARGIALNCRGMPDDAITRAFHHELSSLVRLAAMPADAEWTAANAPGFEYLSYAATRAMLRDKSFEDDSRAVHERGFVVSYGTTSLDNDYNTYAERMFSDGPAFAALIAAYPRMRAKTRLVIASYLAVDARMAGYFDRTGLQRAAAVP